MRSRWIVAALILSAVAVAAGVVVYLNRPKPPPTTDQPSTDDPRLTFDSPFLNIRPDVAYVGDAACVDCHKAIAERFAKHPMGRSMSLATAERPDSKAKDTFDANGYHYRVDYRVGKMFHREERLGADGKVVAVTECEAKYAVGSGTRGKTYLVERDGRLFQSPISWYSEKAIWDLAPGYKADSHFNRRVQPRCLACHCNQTDPVPGTLNSYHEPVFRGLSIGCERCHGPGAQHVKLRESGDKVDKIDHSIVNPKHLDLSLRESVCQQCHLQGEERIPARGRGAFDFRPGMPVELFWSVFMRRPEMTASYRSVGQVEQMHLSQCYKSGRLDCTLCHDPHGRPAPAERVDFYRGKCLNCHADKGCLLAVAERKKQQPDDSCIACHLSKDGSTNIPHTAVTDHRILRRPDAAKPATPRALMPGEFPVVPFLKRDGDKIAQGRDMGVVLAELAESQEASGAILGRMAMPLLEAATRERPDDVGAWEAKGVALRQSGMMAEALAAFEKAVQLQPTRERSVYEAAEVAERLGQPDTAVKYWRQAIEINPQMPTYHFALARVLTQRREWTAALRECNAALKLDAVSVEARMLRVTCLIRTGEREQAQREFDTLMAMRPSNEADLRRAYISLTN